MSRPTMTDVPTMDFKYELYRCVSEDVKHWKKTTGSYPFCIAFSNVLIFSNEYWNIIGEYHPEFVRMERKG